MRHKLRLLVLIALVTVGIVPAFAQENTFDDPNGLFSVVVPTNWTAEAADDYVVITAPEDAGAVYILALPGDDIPGAINDAWEIVAPDFDFQPQQTQEIPSAQGVEQTFILTQVTDDQTRIYQGYGQLVDGIIYIQLYDLDLVAAQQRSAQIQVIATGFRINALEQTDLTGAEPLPLTNEMIAEFKTYIIDLMDKLNIPGASVAIVSNGEIIYEGGYGVRELGGDEPVTPQTLMMIGSTTKSFTTMMMATLVDDGLMQWDTRVVDILPTFAVSDANVTEQITVRNLVCACTGVPRRDLEWVFNDVSPQEIVESLRGYIFFTDFGEAFQYSNQMVATGGYIAAIAAGGSYDNLFEDYTAELQRRVLDPIGMPDTTFSFETVLASDDYALPHGADVLGDYYVIPMSLEELLLQIAPAGALWSNAHDMARYMITELNQGVSPDGNRVVSAENLLLTWEPQVEVNATTSYGLGWLVEDYHGLQMIQHGGNTFGFTSDFAFLPEANLGVVVLTNARASNLFNEAVRAHILSAVFGLESDYDPVIDYVLEQMDDQRANVERQLQEGYDAEAVAPYLGTFRNNILGDITISEQDGKLMLDAGEFITELLAWEDGDESGYVIADSPLGGIPLEFTEQDGEPVIVLNIVTDVYTFEKVE